MNRVIKIIFIAGLLFYNLSFPGFAQQNHFIYIQADDKQQFNVTIGGKLYNSSPVGYVIIPKLKDSSYQLTVNFSDKEYPEQKFNQIIGTDAGYSLKKFGDKGWGQCCNYQR